MANTHYDATAILEAAINSMIKGRHAPNCYRAHVLGKGYVNNGSPEHDRADYLRQLERDAKSELENMTWAPKYAERGYQNEQPERGVLAADWNKFPRNIDRTLERAGFAIEWSDEWTNCDSCQGLVRTQPDGYDWQPGYREDSGETLCLACYQDEHGDSEDEDEDEDESND